MAYEFSFDTNKCTGCHACSVACIIENQVRIENNWRQIVSFNESHHPDFAVFHLSLACNHCDDPPCLKYCPAQAYSKDCHTGSVVLNSKYCIGCKYCSWVCPYDAPKFNRSSGIVEKCTFCLHRLEKSIEPACVALCPTDALNIRERSSVRQNQKDIPGFRDYNISPGINIIKLESHRQHPEMYSSEYVSDDVLESLKKQQFKKKQKMNVKNEWTLLLLSLIFPFLIALTSVIISQNSDSNLIPIIIGGGIISLAISTSHLGKIKSVYRAVFNMRHSWLSREVVFLSFFLFSLIVQNYVLPEIVTLKIVTILFGILALLSMDMVYFVIQKAKPYNLNNTLVTLSALYWYAIFSMNFYLTGLIGGFRIFLYLKNKEKRDILTPVLRLISGYFIPVLLLVSEITYVQYTIVLCVLAGEIIERLEFYKSFDIISPVRQMQIDEELHLNSLFMQKIKEIM